jgi:hypothetical protein
MRLPHTMKAAAVVPVAALAALTAVTLAPSAGATTTGGSAGALNVRVLAKGADLHHTYRVNGTTKTETLTHPDDLTSLGGNIFLGFQNGVGAQGEPSSDGNTASTVVEFTPAGKEVRQWDVIGKDDGNTANPMTGQVIVTVNEDAHSSLYAINARTGTVTHYAYNEPLPSKGGTDSIAFYHGMMYISASAPGTTGMPAPQPSYPAVYAVTLDAKTKVATVHGVFSDEATAIAINGKDAGKPVKLGLTDPDSSAVVPAGAGKVSGDFALDSQGDKELIFDNAGKLSVLSLSQSIDDTAWVSASTGSLYSADANSDTLDVITGALHAGTSYSAVTPCDANGAPSVCPAPGFPANYLASLNTTTGVLTKVALNGKIEPHSLIYVAG